MTFQQEIKDELCQKYLILITWKVLDNLGNRQRKGYKGNELYVAGCDVPSLFMKVASGQLKLELDKTESKTEVGKTRLKWPYSKLWPTFSF